MTRKNRAYNCPVYQTTPWPAVAPSSASSTYLLFGYLRKLSVRGDFDPLPSDFIFWNTGDSCSFSRMYTENASRISDSQNGTRQPHSANSLVSMLLRQS